MPFSYQILDCILGNYHQGNSRFGNTAGTQCACNSLFAIFWSQVKDTTRWSKHDLDLILTEGDKIYKSLNVHTYLSVDDLPTSIQFKGVNKIVNYNDVLTREATTVPNFPFLREPIGSKSNPRCLIFMNGLTTALLKSSFNNAYYIFDSHSRNEHGFPAADGKSMLLKFESLEHIETYMQAFYLEYTNKQTEYFQLQFLEINIQLEERAYFLQAIDNAQPQSIGGRNNERTNVNNQKFDQKDYDPLKRKQKYQQNREKIKENYQQNRDNIKQNYSAERRKENYQQNREKAKQKYQQNREKAKQKYQQNREKAKQKYQQNREKAKQKYQQNKNKIKENYLAKKATHLVSLEKVFKDHVREGPYYICVCCNRCLYKRSVLRFSFEKYHNNVEKYLKLISSFDGLFYICKTCDFKLKKKQVPCQSVSNKLQIFDLPTDFSNLRRLEKVLLSRRIIFKKVTVMPKGNFPKVKGALCNVPVESNDNLSKVLPRPADSNGIILIKLKRKLEYKGHVYFEAVRPDVIVNVLRYLKINNHLYTDIHINAENIPIELLEPTEDVTGNEVDIINMLLENLKRPIPIMLGEQQEVDDDIVDIEDPLNSYRTSCAETSFMSHMPTEEEIDNEILNIAPGEGVAPVSILNDKYCEELAHPDLFPTGQFGYKVQRDVPLSPAKYFNQRLLNYRQKFASSPDYIFFANFVMQQMHLQNQINIAMKKVTTANITAGLLSQNFKETVKQFIANDNAFGFMNTIKGTPAYWKKFLQEVLAMVKQLGPPTFFLTLSCADLRWNELVSIIFKLKGTDITENEINNLTYQQRCDLLNSNPVLLARHFQYRVETFFKDIIMNGPLGKTVYYAIRVEFQVRGSPHVHAFLWTDDKISLTYENAASYAEFFDSKISVQLPDRHTDNEMFELVKTYQLHRHSKTCRKYKNKPCRFNFGKFFTERTIIAFPLTSIIEDPAEKSNLLEFRKKILQPVKEYINVNLNPRLVNFFDPNGEDFVILPTINEILQTLTIDKHDYYRALSISDDDDFQVHLKRMPDSCFVNNYFNVGLSAWEANIDIQPVHNYYKAITYMCAYLSKAEDECSNAMNQAVKESFENNTDAYCKMKSIARAYTTKREVSVQEAVYLVLPELWLRKVFPGVLFASTSVPDKRYRMCLTEKEINELPQDSTAIYKRNMLDRYIERPSVDSNNGMYAVLDGFCYAEFLRFYTLKNTCDKNNDCQPNQMPDNLIEQNHELTNYPTCIPLLLSPEKLQCRKVPLVLRYYEPNRNKQPEDYAHHLLFMFYPFRNEEELLLNGSYVEKLSQPGTAETVNQNKQVIEPYSQVVDEAYEQFLHSQLEIPFDSAGQQENFDTQQNQPIDQEEEPLFFNNNASDVSEASFILADHEINNRIRSLNKKQKDIFDFVIQWSIDSIKNINCKIQSSIPPFHLFISGGGGVGKSHLLTTIFHAVTKTFLHKSGNPSKQRVLILAPTGVAAINVGGTTIHSGLTIPTKGKLLPLNDKTKAKLRQDYSAVELIIIDEISMVSNRLFRETDLRLREIFLCDQPFGGKSVILCGDLYQLPPVQGKPIYSNDSSDIQALLGFELWNMFSLAELTEVMRQKGDTMFIDLLNQARIGKLDEGNVKILKSRFIEIADPNYPLESMHIFAENSPVNSHNQFMLDNLDMPMYQIQAIDECPNEIQLSNNDINWIKTAKPSETGGLAYELTLKVNAKVMITKNIDIEDKLINGQVGHIRFIEIHENKVSAVYLELDDDSAGRKAKQSTHLTRLNGWVKIERVESVFNTKKRFINSPSIRRTQFPLMLAWACTVHKVQGLSLPSAVISFKLLKQKQFNPGQLYVALSRVTTFQNLFLIGEYSENAIVVNKKAGKEYTRRKETNLFEAIKTFDHLHYALTVGLLNTRSLKRHHKDIASDQRMCTLDILCLTETQLMLNDNVFSISESLNMFKIDYNMVSPHKFNNLALCSKDNISINQHLKLNSISVIKFRKTSFMKENITLVLLYRQQNVTNTLFLDTLSSILENHDADIIAGDFNFDAFDLTSPAYSSIFDNYKLITYKPTHIDGAVLDYFYVKHNLVSKLHLKIFVDNVFFSDHDLVTLQLINDEIE